MVSCKSSALCLFDEQEVQSDIVGSLIAEYIPHNNIVPGAPIEFIIADTHDEYIDLGDLRILLQLRITRVDKKAMSATDAVSFVNQPISSLFQDVFLTIGNTQVEGGQHLYPYNGYLSSLLQFHPSAKKTHMEAWGWNEDTPGKFDDAAANDGFKLRQAETAEGAVWEIMGPVFLDMTRQPRYLLPNTPLNLKFLPAKADFVLHAPGGGDYNYVIDKFVLYVPRIRVLDSVISGHKKGLEKYNARYPINHIDITTFTIQTGTKSVRKDSLFKTQPPKMLVVGLLDHGAFNGEIEKSPFNFHHYGLDKIALYRDGDVTPGQIINPDYAKDKYAHAYNHTMQTLNYFNTDDSNGMTMEHFKDGYTLYAFDLTPDNTPQGPHRHHIRAGSLRLEMHFSTPLTAPVNVLLFAVIDAKLEISKLRDMFMSYSR